MLNEAYDLLGFPRTAAGAVIGWVYEENNELGDNFVDLGLGKCETIGSDITIIFNVNGNILDKLVRSPNRGSSLFAHFSQTPLWQGEEICLGRILNGTGTGKVWLKCRVAIQMGSESPQLALSLSSADFANSFMERKLAGT